MFFTLFSTARLSGDDDPDNEDLEELEELIASDDTVSK